jgi:energy-coupling factor transport system substrate-specific component
LGFFFEKTRRINKMKKIGIKEVVATGIGTALFVVLTEVQIPLVIIPNTALQVRAALLAFLSAVYGPIVGLLVGFLGHALGDALFYGSVWWSWVFPDAIFGVIMGIFAGKYLIKEGGFGKKQIITFNIVQIVANAISWILVAPILDIVIYAEPANKVFAQGALAFVANVIIIAILGTLLGVAYSKIGGKSSSLKKED